MKQIQLFGSGLSSKSLTVSDQRRVNVYYEIREDGEKGKIAIYGTPGQTLFATAPSVVRGWWIFKNNIVVVAGSGAYTVSSIGVVTSIGTLQTSAGLVSMVDNGVLLFIVDGSKCYGWDGTTFTSPITDANIPNGATTVAYNDTFFICDNPSVNGQYSVSPSLYTVGTAWNALAIGNASSNPDPLTRVDTDHGFLLLWGGASIEFHQDVGTSPLPYTPIVSATQQVGLAAKFSVAKFDNTIAFLGTNLQGNYSVYKLFGFQPVVISTKDIDSFFDDFTVSDATAISYMWDGHPFYLLTFPTGGRSFLYDGSTNVWSEQQFGTNLIGRYNGNLSIVFNGHVYVSDFSNGNIYQLSDQPSFTDNGTPIMRLIQTRNIHDSGNVLSIDEVFLDLETGVGLQSGQGSNPQIMVSVSKDGGRTFGNERLMAIGRVGQYLGPRATLRRFGSSRGGFIFRFRMTDPVKFAVTYGAAVTRGLGK
ncbi:MAG TPA: packaged DNA stabilization protein [Bacteroidia bacterium]|nr:packaged DNA stabilization protein [Bacteroidia bacterium]